MLRKNHFNVRNKSRRQTRKTPIKMPKWTLCQQRKSGSQKTKRTKVKEHEAKQDAEVAATAACDAGD